VEALGHSSNPAPVSRGRATRTLILDAAVECLVAEGYERTTTVGVQVRAGVSRGRLLHHFPSRAALLVAAAQHLAATRIAEMEEWFTSSELASEDQRERCDRATDLLWATFRQPYFWAAMELWTAARTDPELRAELLVTERRLGRAIDHVVATMYGPVLSSRSGFDDMRELLFTSMRGAALTYALRPDDPELDPRLPLWRRVARVALRCDP
jgi:AcrR family transcriptional regulator